MQRLLGEAVWDADQARDDVRGYAVDALVISAFLDTVLNVALDTA